MKRVSADPSFIRIDRAIVRRPAKSVTRGLRAADRGDPDFEGVIAEHQAYVAALQEAGVEVAALPALEALPDSIFVEDAALVFPDAAIILRARAPSRAGEAAEIAPCLRGEFETILDLPAPGFVDGGDVLATPEKILIGLSTRTDRAGAEGLQQRLRAIGRKSEIVETPQGVLHFKSDCALIDEETVLTTARLAHSGVFDGFDQIVVSRGEERAANALRVNEVVLAASDCPRTIETLDARGFAVVPLQVVEIAKIDAGLSCLSLRWRQF